MLKIRMETFIENEDGYFLDRPVGRKIMELTINGETIGAVRRDVYGKFSEEMHRAADVLSWGNYYSSAEKARADLLEKGIASE